MKSCPRQDFSLAPGPNFNRRSNTRKAVGHRDAWRLPAYQLLEERLIRVKESGMKLKIKSLSAGPCPTRPEPGKPKIMKVVESVRNFINSAVTRATQGTQRFVRWVSVRIYQRVRWSKSVARPRELWTLPA